MEDFNDRRTSVATGTVVRVVIAAIAVWALANLLWIARDAVFLGIIAALVALFLSFFADRLVDRFGMKRGLAATIVMVTTLAVLTGLFLLLWPTLRDQFSTIRAELPRALDRVSDWLRSVASSVGGGSQANDVEDQVQARLRQEATEMIGGALPFLNTMMGALFGVFVIIAAGLYMAIDPLTYRDGLLRVMPPRARARLSGTLGKVGHTLRWWMVGTAISMTIIGVGTTVGLWIIDLPGFVALGVIAGLFQFVPMIGPILSAIPAIALAIVLAPDKVIWVVAIYAGIQAIESNVLTPLVMKKAVQLPPALTLLFQSLMAIVFGFFGLFLAVPILAAILVLVDSISPAGDGAKA